MSNREEVWESLEDVQYRREWAEEHVGVGLAFQIRALRENRGWTQSELGERSGTKQETLSQWENPNYGNYTLRTLKKLAAAFDVGLLVRFVPFSELVNWTVDIKRERLSPSSFTQESAVRERMEHQETKDTASGATWISRGFVTKSAPASSDFAVVDLSNYGREVKPGACDLGERFLRMPKTLGAVAEVGQVLS